MPTAAARVTPDDVPVTGSPLGMDVVVVGGAAGLGVVTLSVAVAVMSLGNPSGL